MPAKDKGHFMNEGTHGDLLVAICTIAGAFIGVVGTLIIEYFRKERKSVRFAIDAPEDLAAALRSHGSSFELKVNGVSTQTLNASGVTVQNTGNVIISDLSFDVLIPGEHEIASAHASSENPKLVSAIKIDQGANVVMGHQHEPLFVATLAYFNPGETFKIMTFYDGPLTRCDVNCRLPGVKIKLSTEEDLQRRNAAIEDAGALLGKLAGAGSVATAAAAISALIAFIWH
jgi:hypothetical protein